MLLPHIMGLSDGQSVNVMFIRQPTEPCAINSQQICSLAIDLFPELVLIFCEFLKMNRLRQQ